MRHARSTSYLPRRWPVVLACVSIQATLGVVIAWSVFRNPLADEFGWSISEITFTFTLNHLAFGLSAFVGGLWLARVGPRTVALTAALVYGVGVGLASLSAHHLWVLYLTFGVLAGIGSGLGYIVPVAVLVAWFPNRRGLATGLAASSYAGGAMASAPVAGLLIASTGVLPTFAMIGIASLVVMGGAALLVKPAPATLVPHPLLSPDITSPAVGEYTVAQALRTPQWYALWAQIFLSGAVGLGILSQAAPMAQALGGVSASTASALVGVFSLGNMIGRFGWAWLSDLVGRRAVFVAIFLVEAAALAVLPSARSGASFGGVGFLVVLCFGGGLGAMPAFAADYFGPRHVGAIFGLILTASGFGSVLGPLLLAFAVETTGGYGAGLWLLSALALGGMAIPALLRPPGCRRVLVPATS